MSKDWLATIPLETVSRTEMFGRALADNLPPRAVVGLSATLGGGKTTLVRAVAEAIGVAREDATSPTFTLMQTYVGRHTLHHIDAYRLADEDEFWELGVEELMESDSWIFIEWAERVAGMLGEDTLWIELHVEGEGRRAELIGAPGPWHGVAAALVDRMNSASSGQSPSAASR